VQNAAIEIAPVYGACLRRIDPMQTSSSFEMDRRAFLKAGALGCAALAVPRWGFGAVAVPTTGANSFRGLMEPLLRDWCDGLVRMQINDPAQPALHGSFRCPACKQVHGRGGDAVYPLMAMARSTGQGRYLQGAIAAVEWLKNVDSADGSWTNELNPTSWKGTTVFAAIAMADAIRLHGDLLDTERKARWLARLKKAGDFICANFKMGYGNINYPITASLALSLLGEMFCDAKYRGRGRELAQESLKYMTVPSKLLYGEGESLLQVTPKNCRPVDLGYNVEESLPSLVRYALLEKDAEVLEAVTAMLAAHLEFMLPDGGWDNSWGTRSYKWTYWGSRTSDGCQGAYALLADRRPDFAAAAFRNTQLLRACTHDGLLYGGPHYFQHRVPACVHHTFCHAKALATVLDEGRRLDGIDTSAKLPREMAQGVREFPEINTFLAAHGPWRATVSGYDCLYHTQHASGGALALLYHLDVGPLCAASLALYEMAEAHNMQPLPDGLDFPLTPRIELHQGGRCFTNLFDLTATIIQEPEDDAVQLSVRTRLLDKERQDPTRGRAAFRIAYRFGADAVTLRVVPTDPLDSKWSFILPIVSPGNEPVLAVGQRSYRVIKPRGSVLLQANVPVRGLEPKRGRVFNNVPGFEAVPFALEAEGSMEVECSLRVTRS